MLVALWIVNVVLALAFLASGSHKLLRGRPALVASGRTWAEALSPGSVKMIGGLEVAGALGLVLPLATGILPALTPLAAIGLLVLMIGAIATHARRRENATPAIIMTLLAAASAALGFASVFV